MTELAEEEVWAVQADPSDQNPDVPAAIGRGVNFSGTTVEWQWLAPAEWPAYRLHLAGLAYRRRQFEVQLGPERAAALTAAAGRLLGTIISPDSLQETCRDLEGEFDLPPDILVYWLACLGAALLGREGEDAVSKDKEEVQKP